MCWTQPCLKGRCRESNYSVHQSGENLSSPSASVRVANVPERVAGVRGVHLQQVCKGGVQVAARANLRMTMQLVKDFIIAAAHCIVSTHLSTKITVQSECESLQETMQEKSQKMNSLI